MVRETARLHVWKPARALAYDEGGPSVTVAPVGAPLYCIETGRSLLHRIYETPSMMQRDVFDTNNPN